MVSHDATQPSNHSLIARNKTRLVATNCSYVRLGAEYGPDDDAVTNNCPRIGRTRIQGANFVGLQFGADWQRTYWCYCARKYHRDIRYFGGSYTCDAGFSCTVCLRRLFLAGLVLPFADI